MEPPKVNHTQGSNYSDAVERAVKQIKGLGGKKKQIDTYYEYEKLGQLLADVKAGKLDKNTIAEDAMYIKGFQIEYQKRYLGGAEHVNEGQNETDPSKTKKAPEKKQTEEKPVNDVKPEIPHKKDDGSKQLPPPQKDKQPDHPIGDGKKPEPTPPTDKEPDKSGKEGNNIQIGNKDNIIVSGDHNVVIKAGAFAGEIQVGAADQNDEDTAAGEKQDLMRESKENYTAAFAEGRQVAKDLIGYTSTEEKQNAIRDIMKQSPATIMGFISGYNDNDTFLSSNIKYGRGGLLRQIEKEFGWTKAEKQETFAKIISTVLEWAEGIGLEKNLEYYELISKLKDVQSGKIEIDTRRTDNLIKEFVSRGMAKSGI